MIFRDDDIHFLTDCDVYQRFHKVDALFKEYGIEHHIAILCNHFEQNPGLIEYIKANKHIIPQIHGWEHIDYSSEFNKGIIRKHLELCIAKFDELGLAKPTIWYPPWNFTSEIMEFLASEYGLIVSYKKETLTDFIRKNGEVTEPVINIHYWADIDTQMLGAALALEAKRRTDGL